MSGSVDRVPPQNLEAEMALLGALLVDRTLMERALGEIQADDFYAAMHETIFIALVDLHKRGSPLDKITLSEELKRRGRLEKVGGVAYLTSLMDTVPTAASVDYYARIVREKSDLRRMIEAGVQITRIGYEGEEDVDHARSQAQSIYDGALEARRKALAIDDVTAIGSAKMQGGSRRLGFSGGIAELDELGFDFPRREMTVVAGRTSEGKTALATQLAIGMSTEVPGIYANLEMGIEGWQRRRISMITGERAIKVLTRRGSKSSYGRIRDYVAHREPERLFIVDNRPKLSASDLIALVRRKKREIGDIGFVVVDQGRSVSGWWGTGRDPRDIAVARVVETLQDAARELDFHLVLLQQISREGAKAAEPELKDIRDSGAIEEYADRVLFVWRPNAGKTDDDVATVKIAKWRDGRRGRLGLQWDGPRVSMGTFADPALKILDELEVDRLKGWFDEASNA